MKFEKTTPEAEILQHPNLPEYLEGFESTHGVGNAIGVIFTIYLVELPNGSPGLFWAAEVMTHRALLERHFPDHFESEFVENPVSLVTLGADSATQLLEALSGTVPRVAWHWITPVIKSQDEQAGMFLKRELEARFSETKGKLTEIGWRFLK
jgi:hypothetical protein